MNELMEYEWSVLDKLAGGTELVYSMKDYELVRHLREIRYVDSHLDRAERMWHVWITDLGRLALDAHQQLLEYLMKQEREQRAREEREEAQRVKERKKQLAFNWLIAILNFIGGSLFAEIFEHWIVPLFTK